MILADDFAILVTGHWASMCHRLVLPCGTKRKREIVRKRTREGEGERFLPRFRIIALTIRLLVLQW
jgi:hypothetical protein